MNFNGTARADEALLQIFLFISVLAEPLLPLSPLEDDVDIAGNEGCYLLSLCGLDTVVLVLVVSEVQREHVGRGRPPPDCGQRPRLQDLLRLLIQPEHGVLGDSQEPRDQLVPSLLLLLRTSPVTDQVGVWCGVWCEVCGMSCVVCRIGCGVVCGVVGIKIFVKQLNILGAAQYWLN